MTYAQTPPERHRRPDPDREDALADLMRRAAEGPMDETDIADWRRDHAAALGESARGASGGTLTMEQVAQMSQEEIRGRLPEVEAAMAASGGRAPTRPPEPETVEDVRALTAEQILDNGWLERCQTIMAATR